MITEDPLVFPCAGDSLVGVITAPSREEVQGAQPFVGVVVVVGGAQYRVGSHRQFVHLSRTLARGGVPSIRFDARGMGDSTGEHPGFEHLAPDIRAAVDAFEAHLPRMEGVVLWGLCDGATAASLYAREDPRVLGCILANPWVRTEGGGAATLLQRYYLPRFTDRDWWARVMRGEWSPAQSLRGVGRTVAKVAGAAFAPGPAGDLPGRMAGALAQAGKPFALLLSGEDLVAAEFRDVALQTPQWRRLAEDHLVARKDLPEADHTFAGEPWRVEVARFTLEKTLAMATIDHARSDRSRS